MVPMGQGYVSAAVAPTHCGDAMTASDTTAVVLHVVLNVMRNSLGIEYVIGMDISSKRQHYGRWV
jgi:hypothetical protein